MKTEPGKPPRVSARPNLKPLPRPRSLVQRKLRAGLPPTIGRRQAKADTKGEDPPSPAAPNCVEARPLGGAEGPALSGVEGPSPQPPVTKSANALLLRGECWEVRYGGRAAILEDSRGLRYIALLIGHAREDKGPIHAKELVALATGEKAGPIELERPDQVLDATAQRELMSRLEEIGLERDRACAAEDFARAAALDAEHERIADELSRAVAPRKAGHRRGTFSHAGEKARKAVGKAITEAISKMASCADLASLAHHLTSTIHKGQWLSYSGSADWQIDVGDARLS